MLVLRSIQGGPSWLRPLSMAVLLAFAIAPAATASEDRPKVVSVSPADGATGVPSRTEIRVRFDRPMSPAAAELSWRSSNAGYRATGPIRYDAEAREFILPVVLTPGVKHGLVLNPRTKRGEDDYRGFHAVDGPAAAEFSWSFDTAPPKPAPEGATPPRVVSVSPAPGSVISDPTTLEVVFDRPMDPESYGIGPLVYTSFGQQGGIVEASCDGPARRFNLLLRLPLDWSRFRLEGFQSAEGVPLTPILLEYEFQRGPSSQVLRDRLEAAAGSPKLREVVERAREASRKLESVTVWVVATSRKGPNPRSLASFGLATSRFSVGYSSCGATFRKAPGGKFAAEFDGGGHGSPRVGSDGATCWADFTRAEHNWAVSGHKDSPQHVVLRIVRIDRDVAIADPFDATGKATVDELIRDGKMEYGGEADLNGRRCHEVRSWTVGDGGGRCMRWFLDAETFLPARVEPSPDLTFDFTYEGVNAPIPDEAFRVPADVPSATTPHFRSMYTKECRIEIRDGADGRMFARWDPGCGSTHRFGILKIVPEARTIPRR